MKWLPVFEKAQSYFCSFDRGVIIGTAGKIEYFPGGRHRFVVPSRLGQRGRIGFQYKAITEVGHHFDPATRALIIVI